MSFKENCSSTMYMVKLQNGDREKLRVDWRSRPSRRCGIACTRVVGP